MASKGYVPLLNDPSSSNTFVHDSFHQQQQIIRNQDDDLEKVSESLHTIKTMSRKIGDELEEQSELLDDLGHAMLHTETKMDNVMKKLAKLTHMDDDQRQWMAIFALIGLIFFLLILLVLL